MRKRSVVRRSWPSSPSLTDDRHALCSALVLAAISTAARAALEELMASGNYEFQLTIHWDANDA
jgi:hypothetical protein